MALLLLQEAVQSAIVQGPKAMVQLPSGEQVPVKSLVVPPVKGRKVVLLGDTCDSQAILSESPSLCWTCVPSTSAQSTPLR